MIDRISQRCVFFLLIGVILLRTARGNEVPAPLSAPSGETTKLEAIAPAQVPASQEKLDTVTVPAAKILKEFGESYVMTGAHEAPGLLTEEFLLAGESAADWTQAIVYQRLTFPTPITPDRFVANLKQHLEEAGSRAQFRLVQQGRNASIFAIHYPSGERGEEQVELALATTPDPRRANELHVIHFAVSPSRVELSKMEVLVRRWQSRFQSQAASLNL